MENIRCYDCVYCTPDRPTINIQFVCSKTEKPLSEPFTKIIDCDIFKPKDRS